jgi:hypothetical protein
MLLHASVSCLSEEIILRVGIYYVVRVLRDLA